MNVGKLLFRYTHVSPSKLSGVYIFGLYFDYDYDYYLGCMAIFSGVMLIISRDGLVFGVENHTFYKSIAIEAFVVKDIVRLLFMMRKYLARVSE